MAQQVDKKALHAAMLGQETTGRWDVLVSCSEKSLNSFLKTKWKQSTKLCKIENLDVVWYHGKKKYTDTYNLDLGSPELTFLSNETIPLAELKIPISGSMKPKKKQKKTHGDNEDDEDEITEIPANTFALQVKVPISAVSGSTGSQSGSDHKAGQNTIHFDADKDASYYVTFHFANRGTTWDWTRQGPGTDDAASTALNNCIDGLKNHFKSWEHLNYIDCSIAEVTNKQHADVSDLLTPKSFSLGTQKEVLNVFINTRGSGNGPGNDARLFHPGSKDYIPILTRYSASIIISRDLIMNKFLVPHITKLIGPANLQSDRSIREGADKNVADLEIRFTKNILIPLQPDKIVAGGAPIMWVYYEDNEIDFDKNPMILHLGDDPVTLKPTYSWSWAANSELHTRAEWGIKGGIQTAERAWPYKITTTGTKREMATI